jgi:hypothetical protein
MRTIDALDAAFGAIFCLLVVIGLLCYVVFHLLGENFMLKDYMCKVYRISRPDAVEYPILLLIEIRQLAKQAIDKMSA